MTESYRAGPMTAGYSGTPLAAKLGIRAGMRITAVDPPADFRDLLGGLAEDVTWVQLGPSVDLLVAFFRSRSGAIDRLERLQRALGPEGVLWVAWPKRASKVATDLTEDVFRDLVLPTGWVDTKVCAIDATWSGLKFVMRRELRPTATHL